MSSDKRDDNSKSSKDLKFSLKPLSACELKCKVEQTALNSCIESIRTSNKENVDKQQASSTTCLNDTVAAWTKCCSLANEAENDNKETDRK